MTSILESMGYIQQQGEAGKKRGLMSLLGNAYGADPAQRQQILSTVAKRGGADMAFEAQKHLSGMEDTSRKQLGQDAAALLALPETARAQAYPAFAMKAQQLGIPAPTQWDPKFSQGLGQLASAFGASKAVDLPSSVQEYQYAQQHPEFQDFLNGRQPTQLTSIPVPGGTQTVQWNPRTKTMTDLQGNVINADGSPAQTNTVTDFKVEPGADIPAGDMPAVLAAAQHPGQVFTPQGHIGFKPDKAPDPSALQEKIALARSMGATPEQIKQMVLGESAQNSAPDVPGDQAKTGAAYLASLPQQAASQVKALAEGRMQFPSGTALKSPYWQGMLSAVSQYDPNFDAVNYNARAKTRSAFTSGKEAQTVNALNTVAEHLGTFSDNAAALHNTSFPMLNRVKNAYLSETGDPRIAAFNTNKKAVADEVAKVWRASGGSESDIQENLKNLSGAQSPEQLNAAIGTLTQLIYGKIAALQDQYASGMGTSQTPRPLVSPEAKKAFDKTLKRAGVAPVEQAAPASNGWKVEVVN